MSNATEQLEQIEGWLVKIADAVDLARKSELFQEMIDVNKRFKNYSFRNLILILMQRRNATRVAGYRTWLSLGRQVKKGEHGIRILAPRIVKDKNDDSKDRMFFVTVSVFDISQTEGEPLPEVEWKATEVKAELNERLIKFAQSRGIVVEFTDIAGSAEGLSYGGRIELRTGTGTSTFIHELAHELLHQNDDAKATTSKAQRELQAEATAYIVAQIYGIDTEYTAANYLATWTSDGKAILKSLQPISTAVQAIVKGIEGQSADVESAD